MQLADTLELPCAPSAAAVGSFEDCQRAPKHFTRVARLITCHRSSLLRHVKRILRSSEDAEDVVQDSCVRLMRLPDSWRGERQVRSFLFKIATNLALDELRRRRVRVDSYGSQVPGDFANLADERGQPDELIDHLVSMRVISEALLSLPPRYREVFNLHVEAEMSYQAISKRLGVSIKTVERDMRGARELCQDKLSSIFCTAGRPVLAALA
jgi:RNA polymerase sigma factor (sigma-70 family)